MAQTHAAHITLPAARRALWPLKHATVRSQKACKLIQWDGLEAEATQAEATQAAAIKAAIESSSM